MAEPITIVGGGLSGLTLGIGLLQEGIPVTLWEASDYPRHRVCGEFICGRGISSLDRLGLLGGLRQQQVVTALRIALYSGKDRIGPRPLPRPALCVSRYVLDAWLATRFQALGGTLRTRSRYSGMPGPGVVRASGRHPAAATKGWRWFGLKIHARSLAMMADLEVHFVPGGYVGLCRLPGGAVNLCGLFRTRDPVPDLARRWEDWLGGPSDSVLRKRLSGAQFDGDSLRCVAGLGLHPSRATDRSDWCVGDAITMIPPMTGNGMSMAFESAELAIPPLVKYSQGDRSWAQAKREFATTCDAAFAPRLRWAFGLHQLLFVSSAHRAVFLLARHSEIAWRALFERTR